MADDEGEQKSSGFRTLIWGAVAVATAAAAISGGLSIGGLLWGAASLYTGVKAWRSHKENQAIDADNEAAASAGISPQQLAAERAAAIAQMQDADQAPTTNWRGSIDAQRAASQNVR